MRFLTRFVLFVVAYVPLFGLLTIRLWTTWPEGAMGSAGVAILLTAVGGLLLYLLGRGDEASVTVSSAERMSDTAPNFLLGYVLPFLLIDLNDTSSVIAAAAFVVLLGVLYARSRMLWANPMLAIVGYHIWRIVGRQTPGDDREITVALISRRRDIAQGDVLRTAGDEDGVRLGRER